MIIFDAVTQRYGDRVALNNITFTIQAGEFVVLSGNSGAGKTTLARLLTREIKPTEGSIKVGEFDLARIKSREIPVLRRQIGVIYQDFKLLSDRTAAENIALSLEIVRKPRRVIEATVTELLKVIGLQNRAQSFPSELSGGEIQRVVIARALATEPAVIFADEPTGNLDDDTAWQIVELLQSINQAGTAVIMSTHNKEIIHKLNKRVIHLENGNIIFDTNKPSATDVHKDSKDLVDEEVEQATGQEKPALKTNAVLENSGEHTTDAGTANQSESKQLTTKIHTFESVLDESDEDTKKE